MPIREETKGRFCKRAVLASVPPFRFLGSRNIKIIAFFCWASTAGKDFLEESSVQVNICQDHPCGSHPLANPQGMSEIPPVLLGIP